MILHGDDENGEETGFHLVQNDGAKTRLFGDDNAIDTVADGIYHLGFKISGTQLLNEDGNANAQLEDVAFWLNELLDADLQVGKLAKPTGRPGRGSRLPTRVWTRSSRSSRNDPGFDPQHCHQ